MSRRAGVIRTGRNLRADSVASRVVRRGGKGGAAGGGGGVSITETFAGANGTALVGKLTTTGAKTWTATDSSVWRLNGSGLGYLESGAGPLGTWAVTQVNAGVADCTIQVTLSANNSNGTRDGLAFRFVDNSNYWMFFNYLSAGGSPGYYLRSYVAGVLTYDSGVMTTGASNAAGQVLKIVTLGTSIKAYYNGIERVNITNSQFSTATRHGILADNGNGFSAFSILG